MSKSKLGCRCDSYLISLATGQRWDWMLTTLVGTVTQNCKLLKSLGLYMQCDYPKFVDGGEPTVGWRDAPTQLVQLPNLSDISSQSVTNYTLPHVDGNHRHSVLLFGDRDDSVICFVDHLVRSYIISNSLHRSLEQMSILPFSTLN